jgi:hypothetical protein
MSRNFCSLTIVAEDVDQSALQDNRQGTTNAQSERVRALARSGFGYACYRGICIRRSRQSCAADPALSLLPAAGANLSICATVIIDTPHTYLYYVLAGGKAIRYGIGVGRDGFTWSGTQSVTKKAEWPDWTPPPEMIKRQPYLPREMAGGPGNPLGARAMYLGSTEYRIHGTNAPETIGTHVSSGCIRLTNEDVTDLYSRVSVGTKVIVLPIEQRRADLGTIR